MAAAATPRKRVNKAARKDHAPRRARTKREAPRAGAPGQVVLHMGTAPAWELRCPVLVLSAGTGGGKTTFGPPWLYREIQEHQDEPVDTQKYLVLAPTYARFLEPGGSTLDAFLTWFAPFGTYQSSRRIFTMRNGAQILFGTADKPTSIEGIHYRAIWADELGQYPLLAWETMRRRAAFYQGRILGTTTPYNAGWYKREVWDPAAKGSTSIRVVNFASIANPSYPVAEFERARREMPRWRFEMFHLGIPRRPAGLVYQQFDPMKQVRAMTWHRDDKVLDVEGLGRRYIRSAVIGVDWGFSNYGVLLPILMDNDNRRYIPTEVSDAEVPVVAVEKGSDDWLTRAKELRKLYRVDTLVCDPSEPAFIRDFQRAFGEAGAVPGDNRVAPGIDAVSAALAERKDGTYGLYLGAGLTPRLLDELETYAWRTLPDGTQLDEPVKVNDHHLDALRYGVSGGKTNLQAGRMRDVVVVRAPVRSAKQF